MERVKQEHQKSSGQCLIPILNIMNFTFLVFSKSLTAYLFLTLQQLIIMDIDSGFAKLPIVFTYKRGQKDAKIF